MKHTFSFLAVLAMCSCQFDSFDPMEPQEPSQWTVNNSIENLKYLAGRGTIEQDVVISGIVISSDSSDNIYKKIYIQQGGDAAVVLIGQYDLWVSHPIGSQLKVQMQGAACALRDSLLHLGFQGELDEMEQYYSVVESGSTALNARFVQRGEDFQTPQPEIVNIEHITPLLTGRLIEVEGEFDENYDETFAGTQSFINSHGDRLGVYTNSWALFANDPLPQGKIRLRGILTYHQGRPQLIMRSKADVVLNR